MEKEILREMVLDRNKKMKLLRRKIIGLEDHVQNVSYELENVRIQVAKERLEYEEQVKLLAESRMVVEEILARLGKDLHQQEPNLHLYADVLKQASPIQNADCSYVIKVQSQLCKAMHAKGITDHYLSMVRNICDAEIKFLEDSRKQTVEQMSSLELELINKLVASDQECKTLERDQQATLDAERLKMEKLRQALEGVFDDEKKDCHESDAYYDITREDSVRKITNKSCSNDREFLDPVEEDEPIDA